MELYKQYLKEIADIELVVGDDYFFTYQIQDNCIYLENVFVKKESRGSRKAEYIIKKIYKLCKKHKKQFATSTICKNTNKEVKERTDYILTKNGFKIFEEDDNMVYYSREII